MNMNSYRNNILNKHKVRVISIDLRMCKAKRISYDSANMVKVEKWSVSGDLEVCDLVKELTLSENAFYFTESGL